MTRPSVAVDRQALSLAYRPLHHVPPLPANLVDQISAVIKRPGNYVGSRRENEPECRWQARAVAKLLTAKLSHEPSQWGYCYADGEVWPCDSADEPRAAESGPSPADLAPSDNDSAGTLSTGYDPSENTASRQETHNG